LTDSVERLWKAFLASEAPAARDATNSTYTAWAFCDGGPLADELALLVIAGQKRATAGSLWSYERENESLPRAGDFSVVFDSQGIARCVIRTTRVDITPFNEVDAEFAAAEGEGDCSLEHWRAGHWRFFTTELADFGMNPEIGMPVVCEHFELVYVADASGE